MASFGIVTLILLVTNFYISYKGFSKPAFFEKYLFKVDNLLIGKDYKRIISSGFLHVSWMHLIFNMFSLYSFSSSLEGYLGELNYLLVYFSSLIGGNLFSLYIHRNHGDYSAAGASGAVCGVIFASIALFPGMILGFFGLPLSIPGWAYGLLFILFSIYGIKSQAGNIGHEAHLGGALVGMLIAIVLNPESLFINYFSIIAVAIPSMIFIYVIIAHPGYLLVDNYFSRRNKSYTIEDRYNSQRIDEQLQIDKILDKIHANGVDSLTKKEKEILNEFAGKD